MWLLVLTLLAADNAGTAELVLRAATHDQHLEARTSNGLRVGVIVGNSRRVRADADEFIAEARALQSSADELAPSWIESTGFTGRTALYRWLETNRVSLLFVPAGMGDAVDGIIEAAEAAGVLTIGRDPADAARGLVLSARFDDGAKKLVVNLEAASRAGVYFDGAVRQVALRVGGAEAREGREDVERALAQYTKALEDQNLGALKNVWPELARDEEAKILAGFKIARSQSVALAVLSVQERGPTLVARVRRADRLVTKDGKTVSAGNLVEFSLKRGGDGAWQIDSMSAATALH